MIWKSVIKQYKNYLKIERGLSKNSIINYLFDIEAFIKYFNIDINVKQPKDISSEEIQSFIYEEAKFKSSHSMARRISGLKSFFNYLSFENIRSDDPTESIETPKIGRKLPEVLSISEIENVSRWTLVVKLTEEQIKKIIGQIEKQVEVIKAYYHTDEETIYQVSAMFKIKSDLLFEERKIQNIIKDSNSRIVTVNRDFFVLEKSGRKHEVEQLHRELSAFGIMQYVRSGRIAVTKDEMKISEMLIAFNN